MAKFRKRPAVAGLIWAGMVTGAARADLPAAILAEAQESAAICREVGGTPRFQGLQVPGAGMTAQVQVPYVTAADLNGDGQPDHVTDLAGLECENAWSIFCGSAGCPVRVWLSGPGGPAVAWGGHAQAWRLEGQAVVVSLHGQMCSPPRSGFEGCEVALRFDSAAPAPAAGPAAAASPRPRPRPSQPGDAASPVPAPRPPPDPAAWTRGRTADGQGMFARTVDPQTGARLDWLCAPGRPSLLALTPFTGPGALIFDVDGRRREETPQVEGETAYLPIDFAAPLFGHLASGMAFSVTAADGAASGRFSLITGTGAVGVTEGTCQAMR